MKQPIKWHEECLSNKQKHFDRMKAEVDRMAERLWEQEKELILYQSQIKRAVAEGKYGFDSERYGVGK